MKGRTVFITGGARSGKSSFALSEGAKILGKKAFVATARAVDAEMRNRIERHKADRKSDWKTYEEPIEIVPLIKKIRGSYSVVLIDCLTLWVSNLIEGALQTEAEADELIAELLIPSETSFLIVSNEVGMGIVPGNQLAREFRDSAGIVNQKVASVCQEVFMTVAGIPVEIKGGRS